MQFESSAENRRDQTRNRFAPCDLLLLLFLSIGLVLDRGLGPITDLNLLFVVLTFVLIRFLRSVEEPHRVVFGYLFAFFGTISMMLCLHFSCYGSWMYLGHDLGLTRAPQFLISLWNILSVLIRSFLIGGFAYHLIQLRGSFQPYLLFFERIGVPERWILLMMIAMTNLMQLQTDLHQLQRIYQLRMESTPPRTIETWFRRLTCSISQWIMVLTLVLDQWLQRSRERSDILQTRFASAKQLKQEPQGGQFSPDLSEIMPIFLCFTSYLGWLAVITFF